MWKDNALRILGIAPVLFLILFSKNVQGQSPDSLRFDLLKCFLPNQKITYSYVESVRFRYLPDTITRVPTFSGTEEARVDSIVSDAGKHSRTLYLTVRMRGVERIETTRGIADSYPVDSSYSAYIIELEDKKCGSGAHEIRGWLFPDSLTGYSDRCAADSEQIYYPYLSYFRHYTYPAADTLDVRNDTLRLKSIFTDCRDFGFSIEYVVTLDSGMVSQRRYMFNCYDYDWRAERRLVEITGVSGSPPVLPRSFALSQNYPNPFNPSTEIRYQLFPQAGSSTEVSNVTLKIYDALGREVITLVDNERQSPGTHRVYWNGTNREGQHLSSGTYFYQLVTRSGTQTRKALYLK